MVHVRFFAETDQRDDHTSGWYSASLHHAVLAGVLVSIPLNHRTQP